MTFEETVFTLGIRRDGKPAVVCTFDHQRVMHDFETGEQAIDFYQACLGRTIDPLSRERFLKACAARWN